MTGLGFDSADPRPAAGSKQPEVHPDRYCVSAARHVPAAGRMLPLDEVETWTRVRVAVLKWIAEAFNNFWAGEPRSTWPGDLCLRSMGFD
jgi:hypothetical protein